VFKALDSLFLVADSVTSATVTAIGARMACTSGLSIIQRDQAKEEKEVRSRRLLNTGGARLGEIVGTVTCARAVTERLSTMPSFKLFKTTKSSVSLHNFF
jgi:hypothetical protein